MTDKRTDNSASIAQFQGYVAGQKPWLQQRYSQMLAQDLARQQWDGCLERNVLSVLQECYDKALAYLQTLPLDGTGVTINQGLSDLSKQLLQAFAGLGDEFLATVVDKHRTSCALSNFPDEHKPDPSYINEVRRGMAGLWQEFALAVNGHILESGPPNPAQSGTA